MTQSNGPGWSSPPDWSEPDPAAPRLMDLDVPLEEPRERDPWLAEVEALVADVRWLRLVAEGGGGLAASEQAVRAELEWLDDLRRQADEVRRRRAARPSPGGQSAVIEATWLGEARRRAAELRTVRPSVEAAARAAIAACDGALELLVPARAAASA